MSSDNLVPSIRDNRDIVALMKEIEKYPYLYNANMPEYVNRTITMRAWTEIAKTVNSTVRECKNKWRKTRIAFMRSLKLMRRGTPPCRPYYLADHLQFIVPFIKLRDDNEYQEPLQSKHDVNYHLEIKQSHDDTESDTDNDHGNDNLSAVTSNCEEEEEERKITKRKRRDSIEDNPRKMFLLSLLPDVESLTEDEMRKFRRDVFVSINNIMSSRENNS